MREEKPPSRIVLTGFGLWAEGASGDHRNVLRIGRERDMEVVLDDPSVSPHHATVAITPQGWMVQDMQSAAGTYLNGIPVRGSQELRLGDVVRFGRPILKVTVLEEATAVFAVHPIRPSPHTVLP